MLKYSSCTNSNPAVRILTSTRTIHHSFKRLNLHERYREKIQKRADELGRTVEQLREDAKILSKAQPVTPEAAKLLTSRQSSGRNVKGQSTSFSKKNAERNDKSPVKALSDIMDLTKILQSPHTAEQISLLWNAFHTSRSLSTGRGYLSAAIPYATYNKMIETAKKYPRFVLPLARNVAGSASDPERAVHSDEAQQAFEFHFMEWAFHPAPPMPSPQPQDVFQSLPLAAAPFSPVGGNPSANPAISTILFTPLQEYKLHQSYATPHLIITHYSDLVATHDIVLLRGEITPSTSQSGSTDLRYRLSQQDAQLLAMGVQRFYLASLDPDLHRKEESVGGGSTERALLLRDFHENSQSFEWGRLLKHADLTV